MISSLLHSLSKQAISATKSEGTCILYEDRRSDPGKHTDTHTSESLLQRLDLFVTLFLQLYQFLLFAQLTNCRHTLPVLDLCLTLGELGLQV